VYDVSIAVWLFMRCQVISPLERFPIGHYPLAYLFRYSYFCWSIGRRDFSTDSDHWPLCEHHSSSLASPVNLPGMFVARSFLDVLFFTWLHQVMEAGKATLAGLSEGSQSICPASAILLTRTIFDKSSIAASSSTRHRRLPSVTTN